MKQEKSTFAASPLYTGCTKKRSADQVTGRTPSRVHDPNARTTVPSISKIAISFLLYNE
jgi:hypothetical protein